ncbi:hypothetical protein D3C86_1762070 [compost metagenome]
MARRSLTSGRAAPVWGSNGRISATVPRKTAVLGPVSTSVRDLPTLSVPDERTTVTFSITSGLVLARTSRTSTSAARSETLLLIQRISAEGGAGDV